MKFDRFLAKLFSRTGIFVLVLLLVFGLFCMAACNACDLFLCVFCGCVSPQTCLEGVNCLCDNVCDNCFIFTCLDCIFFCDSSEDSGGSEDSDGYATDEEFYEWIDKNGY